MSRARWTLVGILVLSFACRAGAEALIIDHEDADLTKHTQKDYELAKETLHIGYGHTSHGSQLIDGMTKMVGFINGGGLGLKYPTDFFRFNRGGSKGGLDLHDGFQPGDLGNPDRTTWADRTRKYLDDPKNAKVNVILWSWCGQADAKESEIDLYLQTMSKLEADYPKVTFVYMTGHHDGSGANGNLAKRNQQIRDFCRANNKVLYDFNDIESYDPDGKSYIDKKVNDACDYDSNSDGKRDRNWAQDWMASHKEGVDWFDCESAHSQALNANRKAYAAWSLFAQIAKRRADQKPA